MRSLKIVASVIFLSAVTFSQTPGEKVQKMADLFVSAYNAKNYSQIEQQFNSQMKTLVPSDKLREFLDGCHRDLGKIVKLGPPNFVSPAVAAFSADFEKAKQEMLIALDADGKIAGFRISVGQPAKPRNTSRNKTVLRLPFNGEWFVFWGGDTAAQNYHQDAATQRFAFDILKTDAQGNTHRGDGTENEDYYAFGEEIVADADGEVVDVITGVPDNVPGVMNPLMAVGNAIMIRHSNAEVSVFAHIKYGSTRVNVGDKVMKGQVIGLCGNAGNSSEPHLHYQVQGTTLFEAENSIKVYFEKLMLRRDGKSELKTDYSPVKGDTISQIGTTDANVFAQDDAELIKLAVDFSEAYKNGDEAFMDKILADDFRYFTNVRCSYKDCEKGAGKKGYINGIARERIERGFAVQSVEMKHLDPIIKSDSFQTERKVSFYCRLTTLARGKRYQFRSVIEYYFQKREDVWKITKIENLLLD